MTNGPRARLASALVLCALAARALADDPAPPRPPARQRPPPMVLVVPLGFGVLLPLTLPTATPRVRTAPASGTADVPPGGARGASGGGAQGGAEAR